MSNDKIEMAKGLFAHHIAKDDDSALEIAAAVDALVDGIVAEVGRRQRRTTAPTPIEVGEVVQFDPMFRDWGGMFGRVTDVDAGLKEFSVEFPRGKGVKPERGVFGFALLGTSVERVGRAVWGK